ncbi:MAG: hypothetical protein ACK6CT_08880, partial [Planctomycetia bacterium]
IDVELGAAGLYGVRLEMVADVPDARAGRGSSPSGSSTSIGSSRGTPPEACARDWPWNVSSA